MRNPVPLTEPPSIIREELIDLTRATALFADGTGRRPHVSTLRRWAKTGARGHKLETAYLGGRLMTSRQAVARFLAAINSAPPPTPPPVTSAAEQAGRELDALFR